MKKYWSPLILALLLLPSLSKAACLDIPLNLSLGMTNSDSGSMVTPLQQFLVERGYLSVTPTGRFGALTAAAVKRFQSTSAISPTGTVGPMTRGAIKRLTCTTPTSAPIAPQTIAPLVMPPQPTYLVSEPWAGASLTIGQPFTVRWQNKSGIIYSLLLENEQGLGEGFLTSHISGMNNYTWTVGNVLLTGTDPAVVPPGNYRIRIVDSGTMGMKVNQQSGIFTIKEAPLGLSNITPNSVRADGKTMVFLIGSGFSAQTDIIMSGIYTWKVKPSYVSPDGNIINFIPPYQTYPGSYSVHAVNTYSYEGTSSTTPSNSVRLQIIK